MTQGELDRKIAEKWHCHCSAADIQRLLRERDGFCVDLWRVKAGVLRHINAKTENRRYGQEPSPVSKLMAIYLRLRASLNES